MGMPISGQTTIINVNTKVWWQSGFQVICNSEKVYMRTFGGGDNYRKFSAWREILDTTTE